MSLRFEISGIRTWGRGRRPTAVAGKPATSKRSNGGGPELSEILDTYDERVRARSEKAAGDVERQERFREESRRLIDSIIAPTLKSLGRDIGDRGHKWAVEERIDIQAQPAIACTFTPKHGNGVEACVHELSFRFQFPDRLSVTGAIPSRKDVRDLPARSYLTSVVDDGVVRREATRFVAAAFQAS